jgi:hypothetical protein
MLSPPLVRDCSGPRLKTSRCSGPSVPRLRLHTSLPLVDPWFVCPELVAVPSDGRLIRTKHRARTSTEQQALGCFVERRAFKRERIVDSAATIYQVCLKPGFDLIEDCLVKNAPGNACHVVLRVHNFDVIVDCSSHLDAVVPGENIEGNISLGLRECQRIA